MDTRVHKDAGLSELRELEEEVRERPTLRAFVRVIVAMAVRPLRTPAGVVLASAILLIVAWGNHGTVSWLHSLWSGWNPTGDPQQRTRIIPGLPWDQELLSFVAGTVLLVVIPCLIIKLVLKRDLRDFGLGLPPRNRLRLSLFAAGVLLVAILPPFLLATQDPEMRATYPLYRGPLEGWDFVAYELAYGLFFLVIEFVFRGYLLLGLFRMRDRDASPEAPGERGPLLFGYYAIYLAMLSYTAWHLGKPTPELLGTLFWGPVAGGVVILTRSIWPLVIVHWLANVVLDLLLK